MGPAGVGASPRWVVERRPSGFPSIRSPGIDKIIIFGHWLSKTQKLALAFRAFLSEKAFTIS